MDAATTDDQESPPSPTPCSEDLDDAEDCLEQSAEPSCEQSRKDVLNSIDIEENMHMVRSLLHTINFFIE